jgi:hypothetical protein
MSEPIRFNVAPVGQSEFVPMREDRITDQDVKFVAEKLRLWSGRPAGVATSGFERQARKLLAGVLGDNTSESEATSDPS